MGYTHILSVTLAAEHSVGALQGRRLAIIDGDV